MFRSVQFSSVQPLSHLRLFATPWTAAYQASLSIPNSCSLLTLMTIESVMPSNHLILCHPLLLLPSIFPSIRIFSNESALRIRWPKYWSFSFNINHSTLDVALGQNWALWNLGVSARMDTQDCAPSVDVLVPGCLTHGGLLFPAPLPPRPQWSPGFSPGLALGAPSLQLAWLLALEGVQAACIRPAPSNPGPHCPSAHLTWSRLCPTGLSSWWLRAGCALIAPPRPGEDKSSVLSRPSSEPACTQRPGPQLCTWRAGTPLLGARPCRGAAGSAWSM